MENEFGGNDPRSFHKNGAPAIPELIGAYHTTLDDLGDWVDQQRENYNVRHCLWTGQTADGRKHGTKDKPAFPWENASDLRTFLVDQLIVADVSLLCTALKRSNLVAVPVESGDLQRSRLVSSFMRWLIFSQMEEIDEECELLANYYLEKGIGALGVFWETKTQSVPRTLSIEDMAKLAPELAQFVQDKNYASDLTDLMQMTFPNLSRRKARKMVTELRNTGTTTIGMPEVIHQRPVIRAYSLDKDLFVPMGTTEIQRAPYIFLEEWFTVDQLLEKVLTDGWDKTFVDYVISTQQNENGQNLNFQGSEWDGRYGVEANQKTENIRLVCAYYKTNDEDGSPETWYTVFHPDVSEVDGANAYAVHERLDYRPARYPFVVFQRERISRRMLETRGYAEIAKGWQDQVKIERDTRIDRASLATNPPFLYPLGRKVDAWGPGARIGYRRRDDYGWAEIPPFDQGSMEVEASIIANARKYFGRPNDENDAAEARAIQQYRVQKWLNNWKEVFRQVWSLYKQYGPEEQFFRVVGVQPNEQRMAKGEDNEKYDFYIEFDVPGMDPEYQLKKLKEIADISMNYDRTGRTDWSALIGELIAGIDPSLAERVLVPQQEATEKEVNEEKALLTQMWSGMDVDLMMPFNPQLRGQVFTSWLTGSETIPATDVQQRLQSDESFRKRVEKHQKQIAFQMSQIQNAQIGRTGAAPGNM